MKTKKQILLLGLISSAFFDSSEVCAQVGLQTVRLSVANEATGLPSFKVIHPTVNVGADFWVKSGKHWQKSLGLDLTYFYHRQSENALMVDVSYALGYRFGFGLQPKFTAAMGYKRSLPSGAAFDYQEGEYRKVTYTGASQFNTKLGLGLEYDLNPTYSLMADYKAMVALPYSRAIPFSLHTFVGLGVKMHIH
jgi:Outer membrane protein beta-barrel domain